MRGIKLVAAKRKEDYGQLVVKRKSCALLFSPRL